MQRSLSFGSVAEDYERYRPGYPAELARLIMDAGDGPLTTGLEIGAGTGKATRLLARAGIRVTAVEPDPAMLAVLERTCAGLTVRPVLGAYEDLSADQLGPFDLLCAAAAFHWTDPVGRWDRAAALVRPGGLLAFFGGPIEIEDPDLQAVQRAVLEEITTMPPPPGPVSSGPGFQWPGDELQADHRFTDVEERLLRRRLELPRDDYLAHLNTISAFRVLDARIRGRVFAGLSQRLPERIRLNADLTLHTAHRAG